MTSSSEGLDSKWTVGVLGFVCCLAVLANILVLLVVMSSKTFRGATEVFVANLAVSDLLLAGVTMPLKLSQAASGGEDFVGGNSACKVVMFTPIFTIMCSVSTMVAIAFDRYFCIVHQKSLSWRRALYVTLGIWTLSLATSAPQLYEYSIYEKFEEEENETEIACGSHGIAENFETIYSIIVLLVSYVIPLVLIIINYTSVARFLHQMSKRIGVTPGANNEINQDAAGGSGTAQASVVSKGKVHVVKMLGTITALFAVLWAPYFILFTMEEITGTDDSSEAGSVTQTLKQTAVVLSTISNPMVYYLMNRRFRESARRLLTCRRLRGDGSGSSTGGGSTAQSQKTRVS